MDCWRLILHGSHPAAYNMAVDEAIMTACAEGKVPPTVRLYGWDTPSVSLGYFQDLGRCGLNLPYCTEVGIALVRRPTGGRAVLHGHDLTFSIAVAEKQIPKDHSAVVSSHTWLMRGIAAGLAKLGIEAEIGSKARSAGQGTNTADCFARVAECDIQSPSGTKIAGAAQLRRAGALLEQGSMPVRRPNVDYGRVFGAGADCPECLLQGITQEAIQAAMVEGFAEALGIAFEIWNLTEHETADAGTLAAEKYSSAEWTKSRGCIDKSMLSCYTDRARTKEVR